MHATRKTLLMTLATFGVGLLFAPLTNAISITRAILSNGTVRVTGHQAARRAPISWEGQPVTTSTHGGTFRFTTAVVPLDCVGTLFDGVSTVDVAVAGCTTTPPPTTTFPATGQITCYGGDGALLPCVNTRQDGDIRAGAALSFTDNGDGTVTDNNTGLMWEKKDDNNMDPLHDQDTGYSWVAAFTVHIAGLNAMNFGGYSDWRLPNVKELQSIVNYGRVKPAVSPEFNTACTPGGTLASGSSCTATQASSYWTSTTYVASPPGAWVVGFDEGLVVANSKHLTLRVRAVRDGL